jgi:hypothetical protein
MGASFSELKCNAVIHLELETIPVRLIIIECKNISFRYTGFVKGIQKFISKFESTCVFFGMFEPTCVFFWNELSLPSLEKNLVRRPYNHMSIDFIRLHFLRDLD